MICGTGVDLIEVPRVQRAGARWGEAFPGRGFTDGERARAGVPAEAGPRLAGRFAAEDEAAIAHAVAG